MKLRKVSKILLTVSGGISIGLALTFALCAVMMFMFASPAFADLIREAIQSSTNKVDADKLIKMINLLYIYCGILFIVLTGLAIASAIVDFKVSLNEKPSKALLITAMVLSFLCGSEVGVAGGITGLIAADR